jgi:hypothetical protein
MVMPTRKIGRPPKAGGPRKRITFDLPVSLLAALDDQATERGMHKVDLVGQVLAEALDVPYMPQEGLPLNRAS